MVANILVGEFMQNHMFRVPDGLLCRHGTLKSIPQSPAGLIDCREPLMALTNSSNLLETWPRGVETAEREYSAARDKSVR